MQEIDTKLLASCLPNLPQLVQNEILGVTEFRGQLTVSVRADNIRTVISFLKNDPNFRFDVLMDLFAMDYSKYIPEHPERFAVLYYLVSLFQSKRVYLKVYIPEDAPLLDSIHDLYKAANWFEREAWDLYGVQFKGHPNLIRILCHQDFEGHPLRKDYPAEHYQRLKAALPAAGM